MDKRDDTMDSGNKGGNQQWGKETRVGNKEKYKEIIQINLRKESIKDSQ